MGTMMRLILIAVMLVVLATGCQSTGVLDGKPDTLYQVSLLNALMLGDYDGFIPISQLKVKGDTGIGTFDTLDGELIMLDGTVYQAKYTGEVVVQKDTASIPFGAVTWFDTDLEDPNLKDIQDIQALKTYLDATIQRETGDFNCFYTALIQGSFRRVHVRSVPPQAKPYLPLAAIAATQPEFMYENVEGTIVALRCPEYVDGVNLPGWHLHFISQDTTKGGHLLDIDLSTATLRLDVIRQFELVLPGSVAFAGLDITRDLKKATQQVEGKP